MKHWLFFILSCVAVTAMADETLAKSRNCMVCHSIDKKVMGPAFKDVAAKYNHESDVAAVANSIKNGSKSKWGTIPMPPNRVTDEDAQKLAKWILSLK